jgi:hypothetical protein
VLGGVIRETRVLLICPIPRYVLAKCCSNKSHIENFGSTEYEEDLLDFQEQHRKILEGVGGLHI